MTRPTIQTLVAHRFAIYWLRSTPLHYPHATRSGLLLLAQIGMSDTTICCQNVQSRIAKRLFRLVPAKSC